MKVSTRRFEIERFNVTTSMPFEAVVAALKDAVGRQPQSSIGKGIAAPPSPI